MRTHPNGALSDAPPAMHDGWQPDPAEVAQAADAGLQPWTEQAEQQAVTEPNPGAPCPELEEELEAFYSDPITTHYGLGSEMSPLVISNHFRRHQGCPGFGS